MDRLRSTLPGRLDDSLDTQIALAGRGGTDLISLVRLAHMARGPIGLGVDRHSRNAHLAASRHDAHGDLAAIGDENFLKHSYFASSPGTHAGLRFSRNALRPSWPSALTRSRAIVSVVIARAPSWSRSPTSRASILQARSAFGPPLKSSCTIPATAASSSSSGTTVCTRPISRARSGVKRSPVTKRRRAQDEPILRRT